MKKLLVLVGAVALVGSTFAQKPSADDSKYSLEGGINYAAGTGIQWSAPNIRFRYFVNDNIAGRLQLGLGDGIGNTPNSEEYQYAEGGAGTGIGTEKISRSSWMVQLGAEYHLAGTDRLSPYFMLGINIGGGSQTDEWTDFDGTGYMAGMSARVENGFSMFGVGVGAGMDFYVFENVYVGLELGLSYMARTWKGQVTEETVGGTTTTTTGLDSKESYLGTLPRNAAFRLGWRF
jgi:opacity protein-like surface antigen